MLEGGDYMNTGKIFIGVIFLLAAAYIFFYVEGSAAKIFGGGILTILGILTLIKACSKEGCKHKKGEEKPMEHKEEEKSEEPKEE